MWHPPDKTHTGKGHNSGRNPAKEWHTSGRNQSKKWRRVIQAVCCILGYIDRGSVVKALTRDGESMGLNPSSCSAFSTPYERLSAEMNIVKLHRLEVYTSNNRSQAAAKYCPSQFLSQLNQCEELESSLGSQSDSWFLSWATTKKLLNFSSSEVPVQSCMFLPVR